LSVGEVVLVAAGDQEVVMLVAEAPGANAPNDKVVGGYNSPRPPRHRSDRWVKPFQPHLAAELEVFAGEQLVARFGEQVPPAGEGGKSGEEEEGTEGELKEEARPGAASTRF
jgi:hypothetical protein